MAVFHKVGSRNDNCSICRELLTADVVAHGLNLLHPGHEKCLQEAIKVSNLCPICRTPIDVNSLITWNERFVMELKLVVKGSCNAATIGAIAALAVFAVALVSGALALLATRSALLEKTSITRAIGLIATVMIKETGLEIVQAGIAGGIALFLFSHINNRKGPRQSIGFL